MYYLYIIYIGLNTATRLPLLSPHVIASWWRLAFAAEATDSQKSHLYAFHSEITDCSCVLPALSWMPDILRDRPRFLPSSPHTATFGMPGTTLCCDCWWSNYRESSTEVRVLLCNSYSMFFDWSDLFDLLTCRLLDLPARKSRSNTHSQESSLSKDAWWLNNEHRVQKAVFSGVAQTVGSSPMCFLRIDKPPIRPPCRQNPDPNTHLQESCLPRPLVFVPAPFALDDDRTHQSL